MNIRMSEAPEILAPLAASALRRLTQPGTGWRRLFADGVVELRIRGGETLEVPADEIVAKVQELVAERLG